MYRIFKYNLKEVVMMPKGARILHIDVQAMQLKVWAIVDPMVEAVEHKFHIVGTGYAHEVLNTEAKHLGTIMAGDYVWHVFKGE